MKLFAFQPSGHGEFSFFVMAENESAARAFVAQYIEDNKISEYECGGIDTDYYKVTALNQGEVVINLNE